MNQYPLYIQAGLANRNLTAVPVTGYNHSMSEVIIDADREHLVTHPPRVYKGMVVMVSGKTLASVLMETSPGRRVRPPRGREKWDFRIASLRPERGCTPLAYDANLNGDAAMAQELYDIMKPAFKHPATVEEMLYINDQPLITPEMKKALKTGAARVYAVSPYSGPCVVIDEDLSLPPGPGRAYLKKDGHSFTVTGLKTLVAGLDHIRKEKTSQHDYRRSAFTKKHIDPTVRDRKNIRYTTKGWEVFDDNYIFGTFGKMSEAQDFRDGL